MANLISFNDMKNEIIMELRNENQSIFEKLDISKNSTIIRLSEELKIVKKGENLKFF